MPADTLVELATTKPSRNRFLMNINLTKQDIKHMQTTLQSVYEQRMHQIPCLLMPRSGLSNHAHQNIGGKQQKPSKHQIQSKKKQFKHQKQT